MARLLLLLTALAALSCVQALPVSTYSFRYNGGYPFCTSCSGPGEYACSSGDVGTFTPEFKFTDRGVSGYKLSAFQVTLVGNYACDMEPPTMVQLELNGFPLTARQYNSQGSECTCDSCDGSWIFDEKIPKNVRVPGYNIGGENNVSLTVIDSVACLSSFSLSLSYDIDDIPFQMTSAVQSQPTTSATYKICSATLGQFSHVTGGSYVVVTVEDPVPPGSKLLALSVSILGQYWCGSDNQTLSAEVNDVDIASRSWENPYYYGETCTTDGCDGTYWLEGNKIYQNGWPGYNYGTTNNFRLSANSELYINRFIAYFSYYP